MWARLRLDIDWTDLLKGMRFCFSTSSPGPAQQALETEWSSGKNDTLATLSLRSAFDLLLTATNWESGSEILFSALTIPDMPEIAIQHGLVPVPVPVLLPDFRVDLHRLKNLINDRTKAIVIAQLFGHRVDLSELRSIIRSRNILLIEDCAQAWFHPQWRGSPEADASLFSFGMIKTATALGGGIARLNNLALLSEMRAIQASFPLQNRWAYFKKFFKAILLKALTQRLPLSLAIRLARLFQIDIVKVFRQMTRGFRQGKLLNQLRQRPCAALSRMMRNRLLTYPLSRITNRVATAERIQLALSSKEKFCLTQDAKTSWWIYPHFTESPESLISNLRKHGFDATQRGSLQAVTSPDSAHRMTSEQANEMLNRVVFLPCYPEMGTDEVERMCGLVSLLPELDRGHSLIDQY